MNSLRCPVLLGVSLAFGLAFARPDVAAANEENVWPIRVERTDDSGKLISWAGAGPFLYKRPWSEGGAVAGFRPLYAQWRASDGQTREFNVLYPVFTYRTDGEAYRWSILQLVNRSGSRAEANVTPPQSRPSQFDTFDIWPFWFSRNTGSKESSYRALFPIVGSVKSRFGQDKLSWTLFPFYARAEKKGATTRATPWPLIKTTRGAEQGFAVWPLVGWRKKPEVYRSSFFLWPLGWNNTIQPPPGSPAGTPARREVGFLPFYTRETAAGFINESYLWPFFGYTDRSGPNRYHETRYFWPFLVQGEGDGRTVSRYGPFYTRSTKKEIEKTWVMWPVYREKRYTEAGLAHAQRQVLYFLYWSAEQRSTTNPAAARAKKSHLWPLYSKWDNGAGRRQLQFPSPLGVFFPDNERVRESWTPLFTLYRHDQRAPGDVRHEALWGLMSWTRTAVRSEFLLGPLVRVDSNPGEKRVALGSGLVGFRRTAEKGWRLFWFDFPSKANKVRASSR